MTFAAFFASGLVVTFKAHNEIFAEARAHRIAVDRVERLEVVVPVYDVAHVKEAA